jgi:hypothetical protein
VVEAVITYFLIWALLAGNTLRGARRLGKATEIALMIFLTLFIGLRNEIGADWLNYLPYVDLQHAVPFSEIFHTDEFGYSLLNWLGANWGGGVYLVNSLSALIFSVCLLQFCRVQPRPWLALTLAFPYLVLVVSMGYTRQSVAIGLELLALLALERGRLLWFLSWIAFAAAFHKTALVLMVLPITTLKPSMRFIQLVRLGLVAVAGFGLFNALIAESLDNYQHTYLDAYYQSQGALIRVLLCLAPAVVFLLARRRFGLPHDQMRLWTFLGLGAVLAAVGLAISTSSTAIDRIALYLIPLQLFVGSRLPDACVFGIKPESWNQLLIAISLVVLMVWLFASSYSYWWVPYHNLLFY